MARLNPWVPSPGTSPSAKDGDQEAAGCSAGRQPMNWGRKYKENYRFDHKFQKFPVWVFPSFVRGFPFSLKSRKRKK